MLIKVVRPGFEAEAELLKTKKEALEAEKDLAIKAAVEAVNKDFAEREGVIENLLGIIMVDEVVEDPIVEEESEEEAESESEETEAESVVENTDEAASEAAPQVEVQTVSTPYSKVSSINF